MPKSLRFYKRVNCPSCGKELIRLEPYEGKTCRFWCDDCNLDIEITDNNEYEDLAKLISKNKEKESN